MKPTSRRRRTAQHVAEHLVAVGFAAATGVLFVFVVSGDPHALRPLLVMVPATVAANLAYLRMRRSRS